MTESARTQRFLVLLHSLFSSCRPAFIEEYLGGAEHYVRVKQKDLLLRGRIDTLYGNLVIEFEHALPKMLETAKGQLGRYFALLRASAQDRPRSYIGIATDGVRFHLFVEASSAPAKPEPETVALDEVEPVDLSRMTAADVYFWLDRHFMREAGPRRPTAAEFVRDFGPKSPALRLATAELGACWGNLREDAGIGLLYDNWQKYLRITYGGIVADADLFLRHTYLALLARLMVCAKLAGARGLEGADTVASILDGSFFARLGIENFFESDFFAWPARPAARNVGLRVARKLLSQLQTYNLRELGEDVFKALYQELVDPQTRHDLGEYYTPDWLAAAMVREGLRDRPEARVLDPACGSGTFLYQTIRHKIEALGKSPKTLRHILDSVVGFDIHPLAVTIARTNYLLALGELSAKRTGRIDIPVFMADSIHLPEEELEIHAQGLPVTLHDRKVWLPKVVVENVEQYAEVIHASSAYAAQFEGQDRGDARAFLRFLERRTSRVAGDAALVRALTLLADTLRELRREKHDSIWSFVLRNLFRPVSEFGRFDLVLGNPPWLLYRFIEKGEYQQFVKKAIVVTYKLAPKRVELLTAMELASLFFHRAADLYLKPEGAIAFVMPRGIFTSDQHENFRAGPEGAKVGITGLWDLQDVTPLFKVPACVAIGTRDRKNAAPIPGYRFSGRLSRENASLNEALTSLQMESIKWRLNRVGGRSFFADREGAGLPVPSNAYAGKFREGATLVPHSLLFVDLVSHPRLGHDPEAPSVRTSEHSRHVAKTAYKDVSLSGQIESEFLWAAYLSTDVVPFGGLSPRLVVLPIVRRSGERRLLTSDEARREGAPHLAAWLCVAEVEWTRRRGEKAGRLTLQRRIDYGSGGVSKQERRKYTVVYTRSATNLCACVLQGKGAIKVRTREGEVSTQGLVIDQTLFYRDTDDRQEAQYLAAVMNANSLDLALKPLQSRGQWGPRDISGKVLDLPIRPFDPGNKDHLRLVALAGEAEQEVRAFLKQGPLPRSIGMLRGRVRRHIRDLLDEIDKIAAPMLGAPGVP
ncbi:MAG: N-6 DNA methylase [Planctomycetes bacterium]|nr:N-6 DNA methylase [Planctomycetota bacterium]